MTALATLSVLVSATAAATTSATAGLCFPPAVAPGPGVADPFHVAAPAAARLNADGKVLYRQGRWDEARAKYRAAEAADPEFLAPALNVACSFVRQERFAEAVAEAKRLLERAYLPWSQEILEAADMGALKVRPEGKGLRAALDAGRLHWAEGLLSDLVFVARTRLPLKLGGGPSVGGAALVLGTRQEVFAWSPRTRRYRQLTSEEGRVLAVARSSDGRRLAYVTAEKLIRGENGDAAALRGVVVKELDLGTLAPLGQGVVEGDVRRLDIVVLGPSGFGYRAERTGAPFTFRLAGGQLDVVPVSKGAPAAVTLTASGVAPRTKAVRLAGDCAGTTKEIVATDRTRGIQVQSGGSKRTTLDVGGPFGAGLLGLPLDLMPPDEPEN